MGECVYVYGDSHANFSFKNLNVNHINYNQHSITMHRIGRDNKIINFDNREHDNNSIICLVYGEIDCRCQIIKQLYLGRNEDEIINTLIDEYFTTIKNNVKQYKKIIIVGIIPPTSDKEFDNQNPKHPFVGSDEDRVRITYKMNKLLEEYCNKNINFIYFNPYSFYTKDNGTFKFEYSDTTVHLGDNTYFLDKFVELYNSINN